MPTQFSVLPGLVGDCYATEFTAKSISVPSDYSKITWDLGNGIFVYNTNTISFTYDYPGLYAVRLSAWNNAGNIITDQATLNVDYAIRDIMAFTKVPSTSSIAGQTTSSPLTVSLTSSRINEPLAIVLQSLNSKSIPTYATPEKWKFITPTWKFVDASTNEILNNPVELKTDPIYKNSKIIAKKGEVSFYYVDDMSTQNNDVLLICTLSSQNFHYPPESLIYPYYSYSNCNSITATLGWKVKEVLPTKLKVTENYLNDIYPIKWSNVPIPVMVTCLDTQTIPTKELTVLDYPQTNQYGAISPVVIELSSAKFGPLVKNTHFTVEDNLFFQRTDSYGNLQPGYIFTTITPLTSLDSNVVVTAKTNVTNQTSSLAVSGLSTQFKIYDLNESFQLTKTNEEFSAAEYFKSLALPEILNRNTKLFNEFLAAVAGNGNPSNEDPGRIIYERIANFTQNHGDLDTAEIDQLLSIADQLSVKAQTFGNGFPTEVNRLLNLFSIPKHLLRGLPDYSSDVQSNIGGILTENSLISAGQYLFMKDKQFQKYQIVYVTENSLSQSVYPLQELELEGVRQPFLNNYYFYTYNEEQTGYKNNIINWSSPYTTLNYELSTNEQWYGDDGLIETLFNNLLTKRLFED